MGEYSVRKELSGLKFGRLTAVDVCTSHNRKGREIYWNCVCDCGNSIFTSGSRLRLGKARSCGCLRNEETSKRRWKGFEEISSTFFSHIKTEARKRKLEFDITIEFAWQLFIQQDRECALTGLKIGFARSLHTDWENQTASLDRIDSSLGYIEGNVQWVHKDVNIMKNDLSQERFIEISQMVVKKFR